LAGKGFYIFLGVMLFMTLFNLKVQAHCGKVPPTVEMQYPTKGVSIQKACYVDYGGCFVDTFYSEKLRLELGRNHTNSKYAVIAYVDSLHNYLTFDSTFYRGELYYIDTMQTEKVWISFVGNLKDSIPVKQISYEDSWNAFYADPFSTTYTPMVDTPFVAFFTAYDSIRKLGIGPMDGCFFESTNYSIVDNAIHKKGLVGDRMPGISVLWDDFLLAIGHGPMVAPQVRIGHTRILDPLGFRKRMLQTPSPYRYDLRGRHIPSQKSPKGSPWAWSFPATLR
jgi:hypothetical protein